MKNYRGFTIGLVVALVLGIVVAGMNSQRKKRWDERITLKQSDKIPYGMSAAKNLLPYIFPEASFYFSRENPLSWDSINAYAGNQAVVLMCNQFSATPDELKRLMAFVAEGNYVFIIAHDFTAETARAFNFNYTSNWPQKTSTLPDSLNIQLEPGVFEAGKSFAYPGKSYASYFVSVDTLHTTILGRAASGAPNFIKLSAGDGAFFVHLAPLAFSNYFILHKNNSTYFQSAMSVVPKTVSKLLWNEYYLTRPRLRGKEPSWLGVLFKFTAFKWGLLTVALTGVLMMLLGMRRRQRSIPIYSKPVSASLDYVKTLGQLYFERSSHKELAIKMGAYFLEEVRSRYQLSTQTLDQEFIVLLHQKSGYPQQALTFLVQFIQQLPGVPALSNRQLLHFHNQLEQFYQKA